MASPRNLLAVLAVLFACAVPAASAQAATFTVNTTADHGDSSPGNGVCSGGRMFTCSLRAAVEESNGLNDTAPFHTVLLPAGTYTLTDGVLPITWYVNLVGAGARSTIIDQSGIDRVMRITAGSSRATNISGVTLRDGVANFTNGSFGGNLLAEFSSVTISNSTITGGTGDSGGGLSNTNGTMVVRNSTIAGNAASTGGGDGGAIQNGNTNGGQLPSALVLENSTISGNTARLGGGIISGGHAGNTVAVRNSTIAGNGSTINTPRGGGGGLLIGSGTATVQNSIVALNASVSPAQNCSSDPGATITSLGFNLESATDCGFKATGDLQNANPVLAPLQNAGGPTDTRPLLPGSPAIDAASNATCLPTDQRGVTRPQGIRCDIGAFEAAANPPDTVIVSAPPTLTKDKTPAFGFSSGPGVRFECAVDASAFVSCSSPFVVPRLAPGTHTFRVRARDAAGNVDPTPASVTFVVLRVLADLPAPVLGRTVNAEPVSGTVLVAARGGTSSRGARASQKGLVFVPLREARQVRIGSFFNTRKGRVRLQGATRRRGRRQAGVFYSGLFQTLQSRKKSEKGVMEMRLKGSSFRSCRTAGHGKAGAARHSRRRVRRLRGNARGRFRTRGRYSAATVRGTIWEVSDRCDGTLTKVTRGKVAVRDFRRRKNILVRAGKSYLARARR